ncbi:iq calmodulin-binding motif domain containing protein [Grosmannia clavigera kw1407]|uniref:Iq calmodulin-binding motif domain containing protein n=1 Tax=Grosmannia clavigera (strain kw1407 / UAMH 11150) TaxID=655863 RepID=F0X7L8_GROCL|nr:iq calmodulin-binding motif domain containing protein [Grosmannia clavigera kw1407]EFX06577.1 iq calmodulin-binding motif domain containing protein [Grosmannia clavigera kw1407]
MPQQNTQAPPALHPPHPTVSDAAMMDPIDEADCLPDHTHVHAHAHAHEVLSLPLASDDTETDEDVMIGGGSSSSNHTQTPVRIFTPPPHIAARFYRSSAAQAQARRKGSAASSRRNSISSSTHSSHGYNLANGGTGTPQSKHIAQHLRRASILADRKARLADRAAHAEQVRLRAAMAKAAVRDISLSEERAQAAAQAREKNLAEIAATCAEEVKRAKAIAESIKEKREQNLLRLRQQMQDRLDEAERRRDELLRNTVDRSRSRGQSIVAANQKPVEVMPKVAEDKECSSPDEEAAAADTLSAVPVLTEEEAAFRILSWWRTAYRRKAVAEFQQLGLAVDGVRDTSFETVVELLGQDKVLQTTGKVLRLCGFQEGKTSSVKEIVAVRAFLSAFLILGHPTQVLSNKESKDGSGGGSTTTKAQGQQEQVGAAPVPLPLFSVPMGKEDLANPQLQELVGKARDLLICFETILSRLTAENKFTPPLSLSSELVEAYDTFYDAFIGWKARDASALVDVMIKQFVELDAIWQTVKDSTDPSVTDTYRQSIQQNQLLLMVRIKKLAGPEEGKKKVFQAVRRARKAKIEASKKAAAASSEMRPREAEHTIETAMGDLSGASGSGTATSSSHGDGRTATADEALPFGKSFAEVRAETTASKTRFTVDGQRYSSHPLPENRVVVHELAINRKFRVSAEQFKRQQALWMEPVFYRMRKTMGAGSTEEQEEHFYYLLSIAETMRTKLQRMTIPGKKMHQFIGELLDTEVAQRQFAVGSFSYERFFGSMGQLLPKLCAPFRDEEVRQLVEGTLQQGDYVDRLEALHSFIDVMLTDHVNFLISVAAPELLVSSTKYESTRFAELVQREGSLQLTAARAAWQAARGKVLAETAKRDPEGINHAKSRPTATQFYMQMLVDVFTQLSPVEAEAMPEMLGLDHERALKWGAVTRRIVTAGAVLLQCKNLLKRDVRLPWKTEAQRVMAVLEKAERDVVGGEGMNEGGERVNEGGNERMSTNINTDTDWSQGQGSYITDAGSATRLQTALQSAAVVDGVMAALESGRSMPAATRTQLRTYVQRTLAASGEAAVPMSAAAGAERTNSPQEPVLRLLLHRLRGHLVPRLTAAAISASSSAEKTRQNNNTAGERLTSLGLAEFVDRVREMMDEVGRVGTIDRETHGVFWEEVAEEAEREDGGKVGSSGDFPTGSTEPVGN